MSYFDKPVSQAVLAIFPMFDEKARTFLGHVLALDGTEQYQQLVSSGYRWRRFADVDHGRGEWPKYCNYVEQEHYQNLKGQESQEAALAYQNAR